MNWLKAESLLRTKIKAGIKLNSSGKYKIVINVPPYECKNYKYASGYQIQVGENSFINIPMSMLENIFKFVIKSGNKYNNKIFASLYKKELNNKPCYVHSVGELYVNAGIMKKESPQIYRILD